MLITASTSRPNLKKEAVEGDKKCGTAVSKSGQKNTVNLIQNGTYLLF